MKSALVLILGLGVLTTMAVGAPTGKSQAPVEKQEGVIAGQTIARKADQGFLGLEVKDSKFVLTFYDKDKLPVQADHPRALLRWSVRYKVGDERVMLNQGGDGTLLTSPRFIRPPYNFRLFITLLGNDSKEGEAEVHVIRFRQ